VKLTEKEQKAFDEAVQTVRRWGKDISEQNVWGILVSIVARALQEPEPQPTKAGLELTEQEKKDVKTLKDWVKRYPDFAIDSIAGAGNRLLAMIDRESSQQVGDKSALQPSKPVAVIYWWEGLIGGALYLNGHKVPYVPDTNCGAWGRLQKALVAMGYEADLRIVYKSDLPGIVGNMTITADDPRVPNDLAELEDHFKNLEAARRQSRIASLKDELKELEQEALNDA
jgi:hypothetical protein